MGTSPENRGMTVENRISGGTPHLRLQTVAEGSSPPQPEEGGHFVSPACLKVMTGGEAWDTTFLFRAHPGER